VTSKRPPNDPPWWDFIGYRRQYVSDRIWYGAALIAGGLGSIGTVSWWWKLANAVAILVGATLVWSGVRRALRRLHADDSKVHPA
jgi:hypothetical protein